GNRSILMWDIYGEWAQVLIDALPVARAVPFHSLTDRIWSEIDSGLEGAAYGQESAQSAITKLVPVIERILAQGATG
ncbi:MAG TPA: hypothetical protein VF234_09845, partial [Limnochordia bacterium]